MRGDARHRQGQRLGLEGHRVHLLALREQRQEVEPPVDEAGAEVGPELRRDLKARPRVMPGLGPDRAQKLQEQARTLLERARRDAELHRAVCRFEKKPGGVYHLYRREGGELWFSMLGPDEWFGEQEQAFEGSYRPELDMSFTRVDVPEDPNAIVPIGSLLSSSAR